MTVPDRIVADLRLAAAVAALARAHTAPREIARRLGQPLDLVRRLLRRHADRERWRAAHPPAEVAVSPALPAYVHEQIKAGRVYRFFRGPQDAHGRRRLGPRLEGEPGSALFAESYRAAAAAAGLPEDEIEAALVGLSRGHQTLGRERAILVVPIEDAPPLPRPDLSEAAQRGIARLRAKGWSARGIARHLGLDPVAVAAELGLPAGVAHLGRPGRRGGEVAP